MYKFKPRNKAELRELIKIDSVYLGDIDTSLISDFSYVFKNSKRTDYSGLEKWITTSATTFKGMFEDNTNFNYPIEFDTPNLIDASNMFKGSENFNQFVHFSNVSKLETTAFMFYKAVRFNLGVDFSNSINLKNTQGMFAMCYSIDKGEIKLNTENVEKADKMFLGTKVKKEDVSFSFNENCSIVDTFKTFTAKEKAKTTEQEEIKEEVKQETFELTL